MFLPTGDTPNPRDFTPWVNYGLILVNIAVFVFVTLPLSTVGVDPRNPLLAEYILSMAPDLPAGMIPAHLLQSISAYDLYVFLHGFKPAAAQLSDLLYSMFLHGGFMHLFGNMLFLWIYGDNVEHRLGRCGYLLTYIGTGIVATLFFAQFARGSMTPLVGASGAISGVLGLYFLLFPRNRVKVFIFFFPLIFNVFLIPARLVLGVYLILDNILPFVAGGHSNVAYGAHIGGFLAGLGVAWFGEQQAWQWPWTGRLSPSKRQADSSSAGEQDAPDEPAPLRLRRAIRDRRSQAALGIAASLDATELADLLPNETVVLAEWMHEAGYSAAAGRLLRSCLSHQRGSKDLAPVHLQLGLLRLQQQQHASAYQYLLDAVDQARDPATVARARVALAEISVHRRHR